MRLGFRRTPSSKVLGRPQRELPIPCYHTPNAAIGSCASHMYLYMSKYMHIIYVYMCIYIYIYLSLSANDIGADLGLHIRGIRGLALLLLPDLGIRGPPYCLRPLLRRVYRLLFAQRLLGFRYRVWTMAHLNMAIPQDQGKSSGIPCSNFLESTVTALPS